MVGWHHRLNGHEVEQTLGDCEGQGSLACCSPWGRRESDMTEQHHDIISSGNDPPPPQFASEILTLQPCLPFPAHSHPRRGVFLTA